MFPYVLNTDFSLLGVVDVFSSFIWTRRYNSPGDFEIYVSASPEMVEVLQEKRYIVRDDDDMVGIIERIALTTDTENGDYLTVSGQSLEGILARRIVWEQTNFNGTAEDFIRELITNNAISPKITARKIPGLVLGTRKGYPETIQMQVTGDNLLDTITAVCERFGYGFKITLNSSNQMVFDVYKGVDRSTAQDAVPFVMFSPEYDNLISTEYLYDESNYKNTALVAGEGEGVSRKTETVGTASGIERYEIYVDSRDVSSNEGEISPDEYAEMLKAKGRESLSETPLTTAFSGEVETTLTYKYREHYKLGDIVEVKNEYEISATPRIIEVVECQDENGYTCIPTFSAWEV